MNRSVDYHLHTVHVGRKQADKNPARSIVHDIYEALFNSRFGWCAARALGGRAFAQKYGHAFFGQLLKSRHIGFLVVEWVGIEAEIATVDDSTGRSVDNDGSASRY